MKKESLSNNILFTAIFWIANWAALFAISAIEFLFLNKKADTGYEYFAFKFGVSPIFYLLGALISGFAITVISKKLFTERLKCAVSQFSMKWIVVWYIQAFLGLLGQFVVYVIGSIIVLGFLNDILAAVFAWYIAPLLIYQFVLLIYLHVKVHDAVVSSGMINCEKTRLNSAR
ncbi:MAG: hypothetical protein K6F71_03800 [Ruminococcus sp.]|uniref:hypothetical protein n=1 Tax=Ruminococcus sp. TaxID=41978 RepID=UPI0025CBA840|nr:hypothetical protein [Ruminococcus sp.]MCR5539948.1 hypothetical protein [Ruminococcus sp.]